MNGWLSAILRNDIAICRNLYSCWWISSNRLLVRFDVLGKYWAPIKRSTAYSKIYTEWRVGGRNLHSFCFSYSKTCSWSKRLGTVDAFFLISPFNYVPVSHIVSVSEGSVCSNSILLIVERKAYHLFARSQYWCSHWVHLLLWLEGALMKNDVKPYTRASYTRSHA